MPATPEPLDTPLIAILPLAVMAVLILTPIAVVACATELVAVTPALLGVIKPETIAPETVPKVLSRVMEPLTLIAPFTAIAPPADIACTLTPEPAPAELSVIAIRVIACLEPLVLLSVRVGVKPAAVILKMSAVVWVMVPETRIVTLVPALMAV